MLPIVSSTEQLVIGQKKGEGKLVLVMESVFTMGNEHRCGICGDGSCCRRGGPAAGESI